MELDDHLSKLAKEAFAEFDQKGTGIIEQKVKIIDSVNTISPHIVEGLVVKYDQTQFNHRHIWEYCHFPFFC